MVQAIDTPGRSYAVFKVRAGCVDKLNAAYPKKYMILRKLSSQQCFNLRTYAELP